MNERIGDKIKEVEKYLENLESYVPDSFEEYTDDEKTKDACEHCFEKIIEASADLAFLVIKEKKLQLAQDDIQAFFVLSDRKIISEKLAENLSDAKRMRNIIAHEYGEIDDAKVYYAIKEEIINDVSEFIECVRRIG